MKMHTDKRCKNCSNEDCVWAGHAEHISEKCLGYEPKTNADYIRQMSEEELARFIAGQRGWYCDFKDPSEEEYPKVLDWLKAPAEVDE